MIATYYLIIVINIVVGISKFISIQAGELFSAPAYALLASVGIFLLGMWYQEYQVSGDDVVLGCALTMGFVVAMDVMGLSQKVLEGAGL